MARFLPSLRLFALSRMASALCSSPHVEKLPYSCTWRIFEYLDVIALRETRVVSKFFKLFSDGDRVWSRHALPLIQKEGRSPATPNHGYRAIFYQKRTPFLILFPSLGPRFSISASSCVLRLLPLAPLFPPI